MNENNKGNARELNRILDRRWFTASESRKALISPERHKPAALPSAAEPTGLNWCRKIRSGLATCGRVVSTAQTVLTKWTGFCTVMLPEWISTHTLLPESKIDHLPPINHIFSCRKTQGDRLRCDFCTSLGPQRSLLVLIKRQVLVGVWGKELVKRKRGFYLVSLWLSHAGISLPYIYRFSLAALLKCRTRMCCSPSRWSNQFIARQQQRFVCLNNCQTLLSLSWLEDTSLTYYAGNDSLTTVGCCSELRQVLLMAGLCVVLESVKVRLDLLDQDGKVKPQRRSFYSGISVQHLSLSFENWSGVFYPFLLDSDLQKSFWCVGNHWCREVP